VTLVVGIMAAVVAFVARSGPPQVGFPDRVRVDIAK
jgi:hypothetical protein